MKFKNNEHKTIVAENLKKILTKIPLLVPTIQVLNKNNIRYGLYAGAHVAILTSNREPTDIDLLIADQHFEKIQKLFPDAHKKQGKNVSSGVFLYIDDEKKIEIMSNADITIAGDRYPTRLTNLAWENVDSVKINNLEFKMLNPVDTIIIKALLQRGRKQGKHDLEDIKAIIDTVDIDRNYLKMRMKEVKANERVFKVLRKFGILK